MFLVFLALLKINKLRDYIVLLNSVDGGRLNKDNCYPVNHCYKQKIDYTYLDTELDNQGKREAIALIKALKEVRDTIK